MVLGKKVAKELEIDDRAREEKIVPKAEAEAAAIQKAKDTGDAVDPVPADVGAIIG